MKTKWQSGIPAFFVHASCTPQAGAASFLGSRQLLSHPTNFLINFQPNA
jgi:hypothetical protein